jgi:hypothetical protein
MLACLLLAGCAESRTPVRQVAAPSPKMDQDSPGPRPSPAVSPDILLSAATIAPLLTPTIGHDNAKSLAEVLDGSIITKVELSPSGQGRGLLIHRQQRTIYVKEGAGLRAGLTAAEAAHKNADILDGMPAAVRSGAELAKWLETNPAALPAVRVGGLPLSTLLGLFLIERQPARLDCIAVPDERRGISRLDLTAEFLRIAVEFRATSNPSGPASVTALERLDGEDWITFVQRRLVKEVKR